MMKKKLFIRTTSLVFIASPTTLVIPISQFQKSNLKEEASDYEKTLDIRADQDTIDLIINPEKQPASDDTNTFTKFKNGEFERELPKGEFPSSLTSDKEFLDPGDQSGIRLGGGLLFDYPMDDPKIFEQVDPNLQSRMKENIFSTSNYLSYKTVQTKDILPKETITISDHTWEENVKGDITYKRERAATEKYPSEMSLTPDKSQEKKAFLGLFNNELFAWYWKTWGSKYDNNDLVRKNSQIADDLNDNFFAKTYLDESPRLNLSLAWNQMIEKEFQIDGFAKAGLATSDAILGGLAGAAASGAITGSWAGPAGFAVGALAGIALSYMTPNSYKKQIKTENLGAFNSNRLTQEFWIAYFEKYLGTPENETGPIFDFYDTYGKLPSNIEISNFDINIENINMSSFWRDYQAWYKPNDPDFSNSSNDTKSIIDMSNLKLNLDTEFNLSRINSDKENRLDKLNGITITIPTPSETESFEASNSRNRELILNKILEGNPGLIDLAPDITFSGRLSKEVTFNEVHINYENNDTGVVFDVMLTDPLPVSPS